LIPSRHGVLSRDAIDRVLLEQLHIGRPATTSSDVGSLLKGAHGLVQSATGLERNSMHPIPPPSVLDADRVTSDEREDMTLDELRDRARELDEALHATAEYAGMLWNQLDAVRTYLFESLPSDPRRPDAQPRTSASPTGPDDERGWQEWIATTAAVISTLAGPHGDSGFGLGEARRAARDRRSAPVLRMLAATSETMPPAAAEPVAYPPASGARTLRSIAVGILGALAVRGIVTEYRLRHAVP
jgi:hypothetical protein